MMCRVTDNENPYQVRVADLLNFYAAFRNNVPTRLKDNNVTRTMPVYKLALVQLLHVMQLGSESAPIDAVVDHCLRNCPSDVLALIDELAQEPRTESLWLVGSRANERAKDDSDWDFLVFSANELVRTRARLENVDVIRVGPSGRVLVEGAPEYLASTFDDFQWTRLDARRANYVGKKFREFEFGTARDASEPPFDRPTESALLLFANA